MATNQILSEKLIDGITITNVAYADVGDAVDINGFQNFNVKLDTGGTEGATVKFFVSGDAAEPADTTTMAPLYDDSGTLIEKTVGEGVSIQLPILPDGNPLIGRWLRCQAKKEATENITVTVNTTDKIDFKEDPAIELTATLAAAAYATADLCTEVKTKMEAAADASPIKITTGSNDKIDFCEVIGNEITATLAAGQYTTAQLCTEAKLQLETAADAAPIKITAGDNDKIDFKEDALIELTATIPPAIYTTTTLAAAAKLAMETVADDTPINIIAATNDRIDFQEFANNEITATIAPAIYTPATLCTEIKTVMETAGDAANILIDATNNKINLKEDPEVEITATLTNASYTPANLCTEVKTQLEAEADLAKICITVDTNDHVDFEEEAGNPLVAHITPGLYLPAALATEVETQMETTAGNARLKITAGNNDKIDFKEEAAIELTATLTAGLYTDADLATEVENQLKVAADATPVKITVGTDEIIDFEEQLGNEISATVTPAIYTKTALCAEIKTQMEAAADLAKIQVSAGVNDKIDFVETAGIELTATLTPGNYLPNDLCAEAKLRMEAVADISPIKITLNTNDTIDFEEVVGNQLTAVIPATTYTIANLCTTIKAQMETAAYNSYIVITNANHHIDFSETSAVELNAVLTNGSYTPTTLCAEVKTALEIAGASTYTVTYSDITRKFTLTSDMSGGGNIFDILFLSGTNNAAAADAVLCFTHTDKTGGDNYDSNFSKLLGSAYTITYNPATFKFTIASNGTGQGGTAILNLLFLTGTHNAKSIESILAYTHTDKTAALTYDSESTKKIGSDYTITYAAPTRKFTLTSDGLGVGGAAIFSLLFATGTHTATTAAHVLATAVADRTGALTYDSSSTKPLGSDYTVTYSNTTRKFTIASDHTGTGGIFSLLFDTGTNTLVSTAPKIAFSVADQTGAYTYTSDSTMPLGSAFTCTYSGATKKFTITSDGSGVGGAAILSLLFLSGTNNAHTACLPLSFTKVDNTLALTYDSDGTKIGSGYTVSYNAGNRKFTIASDGLGVMGTAILNLNFATGPNVLKSAAGKLAYATTDLSTAMTYTSDSTKPLGSDYTVTYSGVTKKFTILSNGTGGTGIFSLLFLSGTNNAVTVCKALAFTKTDQTAAVTYISDWTNEGSNYTVTYNTGTRKFTIVSDNYSYAGNAIFKLMFLTGTNNARTACLSLSYTKTDKSGFLTYSSEGTKPLGSDYTIVYTPATKKFTLTSDGTGVGGAAIFSLLFATGTNTAKTIAKALAFTVADQTAALTYDSDATKIGSDFTVTFGASKFIIASDGAFTGGTAVERLLFLTGTNHLTSAHIKMGYTSTDKTGAMTYTSENVAPIGSDYTVTFDPITQKFTIVSDGTGVGGAAIFSLLFLSGTNNAKTSALLLGFTKTDKTGAMTYTSQNSVEYSTLTATLLGL